jgi:transposase InsO family protein
MSKPLKTASEAAVERFNLISPLIDSSIDKGRRHDLMFEISKRANVSERTLRRYVNAWGEGGLDALKPKQGWERQGSELGGGFEQIVSAAVELRRESPSRSVADIIKILELEGAVAPGAVARSTLQRHLAAKGYSSSRMRMYSKTGAAARRFQKEHRCQLWMSDVKYGPFVNGGDGRKKQIYLVVWIDDKSRYIVNSKFYTDQTVNAIEDSLRGAIQKYGVPDKIFVDNGPAYRSKWLSETCAKLGIRRLASRPYHPEGKGKVEIFNKTVGKFLSEAALKKLGGIEEYNEYLRIWLEEYYHKNPHSGLGGISPATSFASDTRPLRFVPEEKLRSAFLRTEQRKVDKVGCISFCGQAYEVGLAYIGMGVQIRYDPTWADEVEILFEGMEPFIAKKLVIGTNCGASQGIPAHMKAAPPQTSRMLDALRGQYQLGSRAETATTFKSLWKGGGGNV